MRLDDTLTKFVEAFNVNDLDRLMTFFAEDAVYGTGDGKIHKGKAEIRAAFQPQFSGAYGGMRFDDLDWIIDPEKRKAAYRWVCRHDLSAAKRPGLVAALRRLVMTVLGGSKFGWEGVDVFHFDADGKIRRKFTYGWYGSRPHVERALG